LTWCVTLTTPCDNLTVVSTMFKTYEDKMQFQTLHEMSFGYKAIVAKFRTNMSYA